MPSFMREFGFNSMTKSHLAFVEENIVTAFQVGAMVGSLVAYPAAHYLGHRLSLVWFSIILMLGPALTLGANHARGLTLIFAGRTFTGIGVGACCMITPIYLSEISPPAIRGRICGMFELFWQIGSVAGFWINYAVSQTMEPSHKQWLLPFSVQLIPAVLLFLGAFFWLEESPRWLFSKTGCREHAIRNLEWIRQLPADDSYMIEEVAMIEYAIIREGLAESFWHPFRAVAMHKSLQWRLLLGALLFMLQHGTGANAVVYYSPKLFEDIGITGDKNSLLATGTFGIAKACAALVWMAFLVDRLGRRLLLLLGAAGCSISMWIIGAHVFTQKSSPVESTGGVHDTGSIVAVCFFYFWAIFFSTSWSGTPWIINSEIFNMNTRPLGQINAAFQYWFWSFILSRFTPNMFSHMGENGYGVFFFFASVMLLSIGFVWLVVPETKSVPLESMDRLFELKPPKDANDLFYLENAVLGQSEVQEVEIVETIVECVGKETIGEAL
ncbi:hypothetical protein CBER1_08440 [Cercospora berteroae]|uniref:Quinate transporter n=1 Tax=Cercospora berteroae TaxID=357750 RepID=A0A2S6C504_9PEZI|nr:hypothetical protein CBER1_08440 [Cercospora berteroae]